MIKLIFCSPSLCINAFSSEFWGVWLLIALLGILFRGLKHARGALGTTLHFFAVGYGNVSLALLVCSLTVISLGYEATFSAMHDIYNHGVFVVLIYALNTLSWVLSSKIFPKNLLLFKDCSSVSEVIGLYYGKLGRNLSTIVALLFEGSVFIMQMQVASKFLAMLLGASIFKAKIFIYALSAAFSLYGGIGAIRRFGIVQIVSLFIAMPSILALLICQYGGIDEFGWHYSLSSWDADNFSFWEIASLAMFSLYPDCRPSFVQRYLMASDQKQLEIAMKYTAKTYAAALFVFAGITYVMVNAKPSLLRVETTSNLLQMLSPWSKTFFILIIIALIFAISDSILHTLSVIMVNDIVGVLSPKILIKGWMRYVKLSVIIISIAAFWISELTYIKSHAVCFMQSLWTAAMMVPLCMAFYGIKTNRLSFTLSTTIAILIALAGRSLGWISVQSSSLGILTSLAIMLRPQIFCVMRRVSSTIKRMLGAHHTITRTTYSGFIVLFELLESIIQNISGRAISWFMGGLLPNNQKNWLFRYADFCLYLLAHCCIISLLIGKKMNYFTFVVLLLGGSIAAIISYQYIKLQSLGVRNRLQGRREKLRHLVLVLYFPLFATYCLSTYGKMFDACLMLATILGLAWFASGLEIMTYSIYGIGFGILLSKLLQTNDYIGLISIENMFGVFASYWYYLLATKIFLYCRRVQRKYIKINTNHGPQS